METKELLEALERSIGVELRQDENNVVAFEADGLAVAIHDLSALDAVAFVGDIGEPPPERLEPLYKALFEAQHLFAGTSGATISIDPETGRFALNRVLPLASLDGESFVTQTETFINTLDSYASLVKNYRGAIGSGALPAAAPAEQPPPPGGFGLDGFMRA